MSGDRDVAEGRVRRGSLSAGLAGLVVVAALSAGSWLVADDDPVPAAGPSGGLPTGETFRPIGSPAMSTPLTGRLVYTTFETEPVPGRQQRLIVLDLETGAFAAGPFVPAAEELLVADPTAGLLVLVADDPGPGGIAYAVDDLGPAGEPVELARGDVLSLQQGGGILLVGRNGPAGDDARCSGVQHSLGLIDVVTGSTGAVATGCGRLVSGSLLEDVPVVTTELGGDVLRTRILGFPRSGAVLDDLAILSVSESATFVLADPQGGVLQGLGAWPGSPTGTLRTWQGTGSTVELVPMTRLFGQRVLAWSPAGDRIVVNGIVGGERSMWLVDVAGGALVRLLPPNSFPMRSAFSGASFDDTGRAFAGGPGTIVVATPTGVEPVPLPAGAPSPVGPLVWLP